MEEHIDLNKILEYATEKKIRVRDYITGIDERTKYYIYNIYDDLIRFAKENAHGRSE